jgi:hypothetical protein
LQRRRIATVPIAAARTAAVPITGARITGVRIVGVRITTVRIAVVRMPTVRTRLRTSIRICGRCRGWRGVAVVAGVVLATRFLFQDREASV